MVLPLAKPKLHFDATWRLAQGRTSERVSSRHRVRSLVKVATQQTFSILKPILKAPLGAQDVTCKAPNATVLGTRAAAFLFLDGSAVFVLRARGRGIRQPSGSGRGLRAVYAGHGCLLAKIRGYWYQRSFCESFTMPTALDLAALAQPVGGCIYVLCDVVEY